MKITRFRLTADAASVDDVFFSTHYRKISQFLRGLYGESRIVSFDSRTATFFNEERTERYALTKLAGSRVIPVLPTVAKKVGFYLDLIDLAEEEEFATTALEGN